MFRKNLRRYWQDSVRNGLFLAPRPVCRPPEAQRTASARATAAGPAGNREARFRRSVGASPLVRETWGRGRRLRPLHGMRLDGAGEPSRFPPPGAGKPGRAGGGGRGREEREGEGPDFGGAG